MDKKFEVGDIFSHSDFLMLFPEKKTAIQASHQGMELALESEFDANFAKNICFFWNQKLGAEISFIPINTPFIVLNNEREYMEVLAEHRRGWIVKNPLNRRIYSGFNLLLKTPQ